MPRIMPNQTKAMSKREEPLIKIKDNIYEKAIIEKMRRKKYGKNIKRIKQMYWLLNYILLKRTFIFFMH